MAALDVVALSLLSLSPSSSSKVLSYHKPLPCTIKLQQISNSANPFSLKLQISPFLIPSTKFCIRSTLQEVTAVETQVEENPDPILKKKIYVANFPFSLSADDMKELFGQCGTVTDIDIIREKDGKHKGYAFLTMASEEEAEAAVAKFDSSDVSGRTIKVSYAKRLKKSSPPPPVGPLPGETRHKLYVSNLAWKVRGSHLREFFSNGFTPVSTRVVFEGPSSRSTGYGFVSFATREEAEAVITTLSGQELMGRPVRLKFSEKVADESATEKEEQEVSEPPPKDAQT